ncbi:MAG: tryptophan--tRNA ligase [Akkermansia sp.]|nr:tryptophan--tRNA ligase [Akkermansia sp.]MBR1978027.1 tryptophan--tRNA ligase [Akkermansia sp.]
MRFLTGLQPSGKLHIGNYFGAIEPAVRLQEQGEGFYFIANYHAMTTMESAQALLENTRGLAVDFLACGLDPQKSVFFAQSAVPEVNELAWILSTVCPMGLLERCHSYKEKMARGIAASHALFAYPALMAADILLYNADAVPVGKDQKQHLEVTRDLAGKINDLFGDDIFKLPEPIISEVTAVVPGLDGQKMSKSYGNTLPIFGEEKPIRKLINKKIITDATPLEAPKPTEGSILLQLYKLFATPEQYQEMIDAHHRGGVGYGQFKKDLFEAYWEYFRAPRERREWLLANPGYVDETLNNGAARAREEAATTLTRVRKAVGLGWL